MSSGGEKLLPTHRSPLRRVAVVAVFAGLLHYLYATKVAPRYSYEGLGYVSPEFVPYAFSLAAVLVMAAILPGTVDRASSLVQWVLFIFAGAPSILLSQYTGTLDSSEALMLGAQVLLASIALRVLVAARPRHLLSPPRFPGPLATYLLLAQSLVVYAYLALFVGIELRYLSFEDVYETRSQYKIAAAGVPLIGYLIPLQANVLNPLVMARGLLGGRPFLFIAGSAGQVLIYLSTGEKSALLSLGALTALGLLARKRSSFPATALVIGTLVVMGLGLLLDMATDGFRWTSLFVRRFVVVPGALTAAYVWVFELRPRQNFAEVLPWVRDPYPDGIAKLVGATFVGNPLTNANVNIFGHGYANFGYWGMLIEVVVLAGALWIADDMSARLPLPLVAMLFLMPATSLCSSGVFTSLLTHGFGAAILASALLPTTGWSTTKAGTEPVRSEPSAGTTPT